MYAAATRRGLAGLVHNDARGALIEVEGAPGDAFVGELERGAPPLARIERIARESIPAMGDVSFRIGASDDRGRRHAPISPDVATCGDCLAEIFDPADRRYRYAFTNCTNCGPRFTIVRGVPYDRAETAMSGFAMCAACAREYADPRDRRFHAQPVCCPECGPHLLLGSRDGKPEPGDPIARTAALIRSGAVVAIKGLGGYHLAARRSTRARRGGAARAQAARGAAVRADGGRSRGGRAADRARRASAPRSRRCRAPDPARAAARRRARGRGRRAGEPPARRHAALHTAAPPARARDRTAVRTHERKPERRADRLSRR